MRRAAAIVPVLLLVAACGSTDRPPREVSKAAPPVAAGLSYAEFRKLSIHGEDDFALVQKRFVMLDRDNNGVLTRNEYSGY